jgi:hypothetical protein
LGSSIAASPDSEWIAVFDWGEMTPIHVSTWQAAGTFEYPSHATRLLSGDSLYFYDDGTGEIRSLNLITGSQAALGAWPVTEGLHGGLVMLTDGRFAALAPTPGRDPATYSVLVLDAMTGTTSEIGVGEIERVEKGTGVFAGEYEIPDVETPGIVWGDERLYVVHAEGPEITVANLVTGDVETHFIDMTSWFDRVLASWVPPAFAKGPSLGTTTSVALSPDGRFLLISGDTYETSETADGLIEETIALGVTVVDTETWQVVEQRHLPFETIRYSDGVILGVDIRSRSDWVEDVYVLSIDGNGEVSHIGPVTALEGQCQPAPNLHMVCAESVGFDSQRLSIVDLTTGVTTDGPEIGPLDYLAGGSVLMDWAPSLDSTR